MRSVWRVGAARAAIAAIVMLAVWLPTGVTVGRAARMDTGPCSLAIVNPVPCENSKTGASPGTSQVGGGDDPRIWGFATNISVNVGGTISFKIDTNSSNYSI